MNYNVSITEMSSRIDMYLEKERVTEEFVSKGLYEYVREVLYASYITTRDKMEAQLGEAIAEIGLIITGVLISNNEVVNATTERGDARMSSQIDLDRMWRLVPETMKDKKTDEFLSILEINRQEGFKQVLIFLGIV